jgi:hypothetical protein
MAEAARKLEPTSEVRPLIVTSGLPQVAEPVRHAYRSLQLGFTVAPIVAGADKFFHFLVDWDQYLAPAVPRVTGIETHTFMLSVGVVEIAAGIGVALKPKIFGYVVSAWLIGIVGNLLIQRKYYDIALRDFGLAIGAFALGRLSQAFDRSGRSLTSSSDLSNLK